LTAAVSADSRPRDHGLRAFDGRRDLGALADLIETSFAEQLDQAGRQMVAGMRLFSRLGWLGWLLSRWLLPPAANPIGFVWEQDGQVVGNASLMPVRNYSRRWVMANVAVQPRYRRHGIGRRLVGAAIEAARERGARQVILQVDQENQAAQALYNQFGFKLLADRSTWFRPRGLAPTHTIEGSQVRSREDDEWRDQFELASRLHPEGLIWPFPTVTSIFRPRGLAGWTGAASHLHWVWRTAEGLEASLSLRPGVEPGIQRLVMVTSPAVRGLAEGPLLDRILARPASRRTAFVIDYPTGAAGSAFSERGFFERRQLRWMGLDLARSSKRSAGQP
jgi:ribosomal protein S18 acetylase RimI-like enzyme